MRIRNDSRTEVTCQHRLGRPLELRTGQPYVKLVESQTQLAAGIARYFAVDPLCVVATTGATGAIELVRNYIRHKVAPRPGRLLTVLPEYWRALGAFLDAGFETHHVNTKDHGFDIPESAIICAAKAWKPDLLYLSVPNNPTGGICDLEKLIRGLPSSISVLCDLTLPARNWNVREVANRLCACFATRGGVFCAGSLSKSHNLALHRIGWLVCANRDDAQGVRQETRNVVSSIAIECALKSLRTPPDAFAKIERSFRLLKKGENCRLYKIIAPPRRVDTCYALLAVDKIVHSILKRHKFKVMLGAECGLSDEYIRLELLDPNAVKCFVDAVFAWRQDTKRSGRAALRFAA